MSNRIKKRGRGFPAATVALDIGAGASAMILWGQGTSGRPLAAFDAHPSLLLLLAILPLALYAGELYGSGRAGGLPSLLARAFLAAAAAASVWGVAYRVLGGAGGLLGLLAAVTGAVTLEVAATRRLARRGPRAGRPALKAVVVGAGWGGRMMIDTVLHRPSLGVTVVGIVDDNVQKRNFSYKGIPVIGTGATLAEEVERLGVKLVILAISYAQNAELIKILLALKMKGVEVVDLPNFYERATGQIPIKHVEDLWFLYSGGFEILHRPILRRFKRAVDVCSSLAGLLLSLPLMTIIALLVKLGSRGPVFFRQERVGQGERPFQLVKFRTMRADAEEKSGPVWASRNDLRVTRIGRYLRVTRLDEIPQFLNVLRGDMSLIGPRPERPFFVNKLKEIIPYYSFRFTVKPGLSGWAQVRYGYGASTEDAIEKLKYDLYYIKNMSPWLDLAIVLKTVRVVLLARGN